MKIYAVFNFLMIYTVFAQDFSYEGNNGPDYWGQIYETCVGKHQSPINIEEHTVKRITLSPLRFSDFNLPRRSTITNNGHTVLLKSEGFRQALLTGGPLGDGIYTFEQLHFHWGKNDWEGSEDKINNQSFAMELHAVFFKSIYGTSAKAVQHPDGLAVLAYFLKAGDMGDPNFDSLVDALPNIENIREQYTIVDEHLLDSILMTHHRPIQNYFTYNGSLTTPPCSEVVTWIDFKEPHILSHKQIAAFRRIRSAEGEIVTHNFRPVQPLEDRIVYENIPDVRHHHSHDHSKHHHRSGNNSAQFLSISYVLIAIVSFIRIVFDR